MPGHVLSFALASVALAGRVLADVPPLTSRTFQYPGGIPYQVDTDDTGRGPQAGYTMCNSTTETQSSMCQLAMINSLDDFCLWGPPDPNSLIGNEEAETVAWCSKAGHGTRIMPAGTITGVQFLQAPAYVLVAGTINQGNINIDPTDGGGEMDPHGADERGNPLGGLVYSNAFPSNNGNNATFQQVIEWHNFMGSSQFCFKICDPAVSGSKTYCNNIFDLTGCNFVAPAAYQTDVFEVCDSDNMDPVGIYTSNGQVMTYTQSENIVSLPSVRTPASSNCKTFASTDLFAAGATVAGASSSTASSATSTGKVTGSGSSSISKVTGSSSASKATVSTSGTPATSSGAAGSRADIGLVGAGPFVAIGFSVLMGLGAVVAGM